MDAATVFVAASVVALSAVALLVCLVRGILVTGGEYRRVMALKDADNKKIEADRDSWRNMAMDHMSANRQLRGTNRELAETAKDLVAHPLPKPTTAQLEAASAPDSPTAGP